MPQNLDLRTVKLPTELVVAGRNVAPELLEFVDATVGPWTSAKLLSPRDGYGFASTNVVPAGTLLRASWDDDDPAALIGFAIANGVPVQYVWNVVRKMRFFLRAFQAGYYVTSSLEAAQVAPNLIRNPITEDERAVEKTGGFIRMGDFPYGGVAYVTDGIMEALVGFSVWLQKEDHRLALPTGARLLELASA